MDFNQAKVSNNYLSKIEEWEETGVFNYKKKVRMQLLSPWVFAFLLLGIYAAATALLWGLNVLMGALGAPALFEFLSPTLTSILLLVIFVVVSVVLGLINAKRNNQKFVIDNRGEVGHHGRPYSRGIKLGFIISIIVCAAVAIAVVIINFIYLESDGLPFFSMDLFGSMVCAIGAFAYPVAYNTRSISVLKAFAADTCPVCSRSNFRMVKRAVNKAEDKVLSKQIAYTPGKIAYVYGQFIIDKTAANLETDANSYITYCRYCSFYVKGNGTEKLD